jgi:branched-chain amino acid transport system permease protein
MQFFFEVLIGGLLAGIMYSLVALGFVLIFKASGVFNFAQGAMVFFAALTTVGFASMGAPFWLAVVLALAVMAVLAFLTERVVLRPVVPRRGRRATRVGGERARARSGHRR